MSYCRFSCMDFGCDLYCYEAYDGYITHVASNKFVGDIPKCPPLPESDDEVALADWMKAHRAQGEFLDAAPRKPLGLPHDGERFSDATLEDFRARVVMLMAAGYRAPDYLLARIDAEIAA